VGLLLRSKSLTSLGGALTLSGASIVIGSGAVGTGWSDIGCRNAVIVGKALVALLSDLARFGR